MNRGYLLSRYCLAIAILLAVPAMLSAQSSFDGIYDLMQVRCAECHGGASTQAGLNLVGLGSTPAEKRQSVYQSLVNAQPSNTYSKNQGHKRIYPGRPDKSLLFRKINRSSFEPTVVLHIAEGEQMPANGNLSSLEMEKIRQWILYGAPQDGQVMDESLLADFYANGGIKAFPDGPPPAPAAGAGFQIKMGPFYIKPTGEVEYYQKWETNLPEDLEVARVDMAISNYSHHLVLYDFKNQEENLVEPGLRLEPHHFNIGLVTAVQQATDLVLPQGTAFRWVKNTVLDLNSHYINYSSERVFQAEAYINVYTQPKGQAKQVMYSSLIPNVAIYIPNNGNTITFNHSWYENLPGNAYIWALMGHTHKYGTGYKIYRRNPNGTKGELIYDAACGGGEPGCVSPFFDYKHIPLQMHWPFLPIALQQGLIHEASYSNDGPQPVWFGPTSKDEMMVMSAMYTLDTAGLGILTGLQEQEALNGLRLAPNPAQEKATVFPPDPAGSYLVDLFDLSGQAIAVPISRLDAGYELDTRQLSPGLYLLRVREQGSGRQAIEKLLITD